MAVFAWIALVLSTLNLCVSVVCAIAGMIDVANRGEYRSIGWAAVAALFFIARRT